MGRAIRAMRPDVVAFSIMTVRVAWAINLARRIKEEAGIRNIFGGPHPTFAPDDVIERDAIDMVCIGEGEGALLDLAERIDGGWEGHEEIRNLWARKNGAIVRNPLRCLVEDLDGLPFQDREIYYYKYPLLGQLRIKRFLVGRGCPYQCAFCANPGYRRMYEGKGRYCRKRSRESVISEIKQVRDRYGLGFVVFTDDTFTTDRDYLYGFLDLYEREIRVPFSCQTRANEVDREMAQALKRAGCHTVAFGIESASERIREGVLRKGITDAQIENAARVFKEKGLTFGVYSIIGAPTETVAEAVATLRMTARIQSDAQVASRFRLLPGTDIARAVGAPPRDGRPGKGEPSVASAIPVEARTARQMENLYDLFDLGVIFPRLIPLIEKLIKWRGGWAFRAVRIGTLGYKTVKRIGVSPWVTARMGWKMRNMNE